MKILNGTDIIEISRIKKSIETTEKSFINRIYTQNEIDYCEKKKDQKYESYAVRFAAKEAVYKAVSSKAEESISWQDIEITNDEKGKPYVNLKKEIEGLDYIEISLSHSKEYAVAYAIAVFKEN